MIHRHSAIDPVIWRMKMDGRLGRNPLMGSLSAALHVVMRGAGHILRLILAKLQLFPLELLPHSHDAGCAETLRHHRSPCIQLKTGLLTAD